MPELKQQIFVAACPDYFPESAFALAKSLAAAYSKNICLLGIRFGKRPVDADAYRSGFERFVGERAKECDGFALDFKIMDANEDFTQIIESSEASMLIFEVADKCRQFCKIQPLLDICRDLRIPYFFVKPGQQTAFSRLLVPVGFLLEEREKGPYSSSLGRFFGSEILLMPAKDYGSKARANADAIGTVLTKASVRWQEVEASKDSFKVELEAADKTSGLNADLLIISASRDYGLDDLVFGPKERKVIQKCLVPVMVINPRGDLYALCG